ncbi:MAG: septum formation initiator, partial [Legionella sp.]
MEYFGMYLFKFSTLTLALTLTTTTTFASPIDALFQQKLLQKQTLSAQENLAIVEEKFPQRIDHQSLDLGTFSQRYFVDESFAKNNDNAPVFLFLCGEASCDKRLLLGNMRVLAEKFHAKLIALEHRYYGISWPTKNFSVKELQYLNTDNALKDIAYFKEHITEKKHWNGKWVIFGGSYSGSLAAYFRAQYPNHVVGAISSSAPVQVRENFADFDAKVTEVVGSECANNMRLSIQQIEAAQADPDRMRQIKKQFSSEAVVDDVDFLGLVSDLGGGAIQYGMTDLFCGMLAKSRNPLDGYAQFVNYALMFLNIKAVQLTPQGALSENPADYNAALGMRQWRYQDCTEYGYWPYAHSNSSQSTRSTYLDEEYYRKLCKRVFGIEQPANTQYIMDKFYKPLLDETTSHIYFLNGEYDPWTALSLTNATHNTNNNLNYFLIEKGSHCTDIKH